jgi:hypothetical protein
VWMFAAFCRYSGAQSYRRWIGRRLMGVPHVRLTCIREYGAAMGSRNVLVDCLSRLGAAAAVLTAELQGGDGVFTVLARECGQAAHCFDGVMSHSFNCSRFSG